MHVDKKFNFFFLLPANDTMHAIEEEEGKESHDDNRLSELILEQLEDLNSLLKSKQLSKRSPAEFDEPYSSFLGDDPYNRADRSHIPIPYPRIGKRNAIIPMARVGRGPSSVRLTKKSRGIRLTKKFGQIPMARLGKRAAEGARVARALGAQIPMARLGKRDPR